MDSESANKNHTSYLDVSESNPLGKYEKENHKSLVNQKSSAQ